MSVDANITLQDFRAFVGFVTRHKNPLLRFIEPLVAGIGCAVVLQAIAALFQVTYDGQTMAITMVALLATLLLFAIFRSRRALPNEGRLVLGPKRIELSAEGVRVSSADFDGLYRWTLVDRIEVTPQQIFIMVDRNAAVIVPRAAFRSEAEAETFVTEARSYLRKR